MAKIENLSLEKLQERYRALKEIAVDRLGQIDGEWGNGTATPEELEKDLDDEIDERLHNDRMLEFRKAIGP